MLYNSKLSRRYSKLKHSIVDIHRIICELDRKTGLRASDCDIIIDKHLDTLGCFCCVYSKVDIKELAQEGRALFEDKVGNEGLIKFPTSPDKWVFRFKEEILEWEYPMLREIVIHEYAHYYELFKPECLDINYVTHGKIFAKIVESLGGKLIFKSVAEATELVDINKVQQWRFNYRQKVNPNLVTVNLCWGEHVGEALIFGLPYNGMRYKNLKNCSTNIHSKTNISAKKNYWIAEMLNYSLMVENFIVLRNYLKPTKKIVNI